MRFDPACLRLYLVTDSSLARGRALVDIVRAAVAGGATIVQLREKSMETRPFIEEARALKAALAGTGVPLIINDRIDVALAIGADGVHVGENDMPADEARRLMGPDAIIGLSVLAPPTKSELTADYLAASPVFSTSTKTDTGPALGLAGLGHLRQTVSHPLVAIGGINLTNAREVMATGIDGIAVVSAIMSADDPRLAASELCEMMR